MDERLSLREVFDRLAAGEPAVVPADLEPGLLGHALRDYADTAPMEVAEHLETFTAPLAQGATVDPRLGLDLLSSLPAEPDDPVETAGTADVDVDPMPALAADLDFGTGTTELPLADADDADADSGDDIADGGDDGLGSDLDDVTLAPAAAHDGVDWWSDLADPADDGDPGDGDDIDDGPLDG